VPQCILPPLLSRQLGGFGPVVICVRTATRTPPFGV
jgi:hypothetical protein